MSKQILWKYYLAHFWLTFIPFKKTIGNDRNYPGSCQPNAAQAGLLKFQFPHVKTNTGFQLVIMGVPPI